MIISIETSVHAPIKKVWACWTSPNHIVNWNFASDEWCCPSATNDPVEGKSFSWRMEAKDGSMGFDFTGTYTKVIEHKLLEYTLGDDRTVSVSFEEYGDQVLVKESFETEDENSAELQRAGWQAILNNFKGYVEGLGV